MIVQPYTVAVMVPIRNALEKLASELGKTYSDYNVLCKDNDIIQVVQMRYYVIIYILTFTFYILGCYQKHKCAWN